MYIKPVPGRQVHDPERGCQLPEAGRTIEPTQYWLRRIADGDIVEADPPADPKPVVKPPEAS